MRAFVYFYFIFSVKERAFCGGGMSVYFGCQLVQVSTCSALAKHLSDEQHVCRNRDIKIVAAPLEDLIYSLRTIIYGMHDCYFEQKFVKAVEKFSDLCVCVCKRWHT